MSRNGLDDTAPRALSSVLKSAPTHVDSFERPVSTPPLAPTPAITGATEGTPCSPERTWTHLSRLVAAPGRSRMRIWNPDTGKFDATAKRTDRLPSRPAAVYLYHRSRTQLLWLDFDAKHHGAAAVDADLATATAWITQCGGVVVTDRSTSGGRHLLCPLAIGTTASLDEITHLVRILATRLPTLDITPNTNAETGCMTPPGSPCREGGYRQLDCPLDAALAVFTTRSAPDLLPRLYMLLGALNPSPHRRTNTGPADPSAYTEGVGDDRRLIPAHIRDAPLPTAVADYAIHGTISISRPTWQSNHEPRQSVVVHAIARGHSLATLRDFIAPTGPWHHGLGNAYTRYGYRAEQALARDVDKAFTWLITNVLDSSPLRHKSKYTPGGAEREGPRGPKSLRDWLSNAIAWADREFAGKRYRWTVHAVFQTMAFHALVAGEQRSGTWLVGVGGRTLSLGCGLLSEDTVWRALADLRERAGSPLVLVRHHVGTEPDVYALTLHNRVTTDPARAERIRVEAVHEAWIVLGHHLRRIYELVTHHGLRAKADIYAAAGVPRATGDAMVLDLQISGLIHRGSRGSVAPGTRTLDDIAEQHGLSDERTARIERYRYERAAWREWLIERERSRNEAPTEHATTDPGRLTPGWDGPGDGIERDYLESVMATGPPPLDGTDLEREAIEIIADVLGAVIVAG